jgi:hypothetical protein
LGAAFGGLLWNFLSYGRTLNTTKQCSKSLQTLRSVGVIENLLLDEEAKLKKYEEDHKKR